VFAEVRNLPWQWLVGTEVSELVELLLQVGLDYCFLMLLLVEFLDMITQTLDLEIVKLSPLSLQTSSILLAGFWKTGSIHSVAPSAGACER